jgi:hypothetical protein
MMNPMLNCPSTCSPKAQINNECGAWLSTTPCNCKRTSHLPASGQSRLFVSRGAQDSSAHHSSPRRCLALFSCCQEPHSLVIRAGANNSIRLAPATHALNVTPRPRHTWGCWRAQGRNFAHPAHLAPLHHGIHASTCQSISFAFFQPHTHCAQPNANSPSVCAGHARR